jgi:hypothetical protein
MMKCNNYREKTPKTPKTFASLLDNGVMVCGLFGLPFRLLFMCSQYVQSRTLPFINNMLKQQF